jgi:hypothetical protein
MKTRWPWGAIVVVLLPLVFCLDVPKAWAQGLGSGAILGSVTDPSGAAIPDAEVTITNTATQQTRVLRSDQAGSFDAEGLAASGIIYNVTVKKEGFETFVSEGIKLDTGMRLPVNAQLKLGAASSEITVSAASVQVQTESGTTGGVIGSTQIQELQLNGRNFLSLQMLTPGVNPTDSVQEQGGGGLTTFNNSSINGLSIEFSTVMIDGIYNMNSGDESQININPSMESIAEFRVLTSSYSAKYGLSGNGIVEVETKSGTKDFHGSGYDYLRNDAFDARNYFSSNVPALKQNIFGFSIGGPVMIPHKYNTSRSKTFFFGSEEFRRRHVGEVFQTTVPTAQMLQGDFSAVPGSPGLTLSPDLSSQGILAQEYPGTNCFTSSTQLNAACFDPNSKLEAGRYWVPPNSSGFLNYKSAPTEIITQHEDLWRLDHHFNEKYSLMGRYAREVVQDNSAVGSQVIGWTRPGAEPVIGDRIGTTSFNNMIRFNMQMSPTITNTMTFAQTSDKPRLRTTADAGLIPGFNAVFPYGDNVDLYKRSPVVTFAGGWAPMGVSSVPLDASDGELFAADDFVMVKGHHVIQAGLLWMKGVKRQSNGDVPNGDYSFGGGHTGNPVADFLLGLDSSFTQSAYEPRGYLHYWQIEEYIQDDWKVTPKLTINMGLRNLFYSPDTRDGNGVTDFDIRDFNPAVAPEITPSGQFVFNAQGQVLTSTGTVGNPLNGLIYRGQGGITPGLYSTPKLLPQPRFGFAYDLGGNQKWVIRGGGSLGYNRVPLNQLLAEISNPPLVPSSTYYNGTMTHPALGSSSTLTPYSIETGGIPGQTFSAPRIGNWNLTVERQISSAGVVSLAYVGSAARDLRLTTDINFPVPVSAPSVGNAGCLSAGESASPAGGFNFDPCLNQGIVSPTYTRLTYPGWGQILANDQGTGTDGNTGTANYHSLQAAFRYQAHGLTLTSAYTYGKSLSEFSGTGSGTENPRNAFADYGPVSFDRTQMLNLSYVYALPFLKDRKDLVGKGLGGWTVSGLTAIESGFPITMGVTGFTGLATRPNCVANAVGPKSFGEWFNTSAFTMPGYGYFGNCGVGVARDPGLDIWNGALYKTFPIGERLKTQFRAEFFNFPNHTNFSGVSSTLGTGNFGQLTSAFQPRILEFALRFDF